MTELKCIVIDDEPYALTQIEQLILDTPGIIHEQSFDNAFDAMNYLHNHKHVDLILSDIGMPFINGIEAAPLLKPFCDFLVFVTGHRNYAEESFEIGVDGYLTKPLRKLKFIQQIQKLLDLKNKCEEMVSDDRFILVKGSLKQTYISIEVANIMHIKALSNYVQIHLNGGEIQTTYISLSEMERMLRNRPGFLRINRSEIVSFNYVTNIYGYHLTLKNGTKHDVGKTYKKPFEEFLKRRTPGNQGL